MRKKRLVGDWVECSWSSALVSYFSVQISSFWEKSGAFDPDGTTMVKSMATTKPRMP